MSKINWDTWDNTSESGFNPLERGAFLCEVKAIHDAEDKQHVIVEWDIIDPKFKDHFKNLKNEDGSWAYDARLYRSYKAENYSFLKRWVTTLEKSNPGYSFRATNADFTKWVGLKFIGVFGDKEVPVADDNGKPKVYVKLRDVRSTDALNRGDIKIPKDIERLNDFETNMFKEKYEATRVATAEETRQILAEQKAAIDASIPDNAPTQNIPVTDNKYPF